MRFIQSLFDLSCDEEGKINEEEINKLKNDIYKMKKDIYLQSNYTQKFIEIIEPTPIIQSKFFINNANITKVKLPKSLKIIQNGAFCNCVNIENIEIPEDCLLDTIEAGAFANCISLKDIRIPNKITTIEESTFKGCISLISISFPKSLQQIKKEAFLGCKNLLKVLLLPSLKSIGNRSFSECEKLSYFSLPGVLAVIPFDENISFQENVSNHFSIPLDCFYKSFNKSETKLILIIEDICNSIDDNSFNSCEMIEQIHINIGNEISFGDSSFCNCRNYSWCPTNFPGSWASIKPKLLV